VLVTRILGVSTLFLYEKRLFLEVQKLKKMHYGTLLGLNHGTLLGRCKIQKALEQLYNIK
jgi:hypothetical protein